MNIPLFFGIFSALSIVYLIVGIIAGRKNKTHTDYFLAGRNVGLIPLALTLVATQIGGALLLGTSQAAYHLGAWSILYTAGIAIGFILLGLWFAPKMREFNAETNAHVLEIAYQSTTLRKIASLISIAAMVGILVGQIVATKTVFVSMGLNQVWLLPLFWFIVLAYTLFGGLAAVIATDVVQALVIIIIFVGIVIYHGLLSGVSFQIWRELLKGSTMPADLSLTTLLLMPALFSLVEQDLAQRFFSARNTTIAAQSALLAAGCIILFSLIPIYLGTLARIVLPGLPPDASPLLPLLEHIGGSIVSAVALCALAAAVISTSDSLLCAASSNMVQDFSFARTVAPKSVWFGQLVTGTIGLAALLTSYWAPPNILQIMVRSYGLCVHTLVVPSVAAYLLKKPSKTGAWAALIAGAVTFSIIGILDYKQLELLPLILSTASYIIVAGYTSCQM